ncbi:glycosyl transferase [Kappamyces sp. JEL0680]|nr:glycosyl transferase [Kappamyces sp. JEL0680]
MLVLQNLEHKSLSTVLFQRLSVMGSEGVYFYSVYRYVAIADAKTLEGLCPSEAGIAGLETQHWWVCGMLILALLILCHPGILMVDHIHFQYNSMLYGIQMLSLASFYEQRHLEGGFWFAVVLNFKHIYLYQVRPRISHQAPAYFVYLLAGYCFNHGRSFSVGNFAKLGVFLASFGPFYRHLPQLLSRLFPFGRGLTHAYWAPNVWALYSFLDRVLCLVLRRKGASLTRGLVGDVVFGVLPAVPPLLTAVLTVLFQLPILAKVWASPTPRNFLHALLLSGWASFLFGYHVHEKAILLVLIPFSLLAMDRPFQQAYVITSVAGIFSLFPLLYEAAEFPIKVLLLAIFTVHLSQLLTFQWYTKLYVLGIVLVGCYTSVGHVLLFGERLEFLPLMLISVYTSLGICFGFLATYRACIKE